MSERSRFTTNQTGGANLIAVPVGCYVVRTYRKGRDPEEFDVVAFNADGIPLVMADDCPGLLVPSELDGVRVWHLERKRVGSSRPEPSQFRCANSQCARPLGIDPVVLITTAHVRRFCCVECIAEGKRAADEALPRERVDLPWFGPGSEDREPQPPSS
jgi:hypothetical protein